MGVILCHLLRQSSPGWIPPEQTSDAERHRGRRESRGHSPLTPTKSSSIRKPSLPTDLLFLASGLWLREVCELIQNTEDEAGGTRTRQVRLPNAGG